MRGKANTRTNKPVAAKAEEVSAAQGNNVDANAEVQVQATEQKYNAKAGKKAVYVVNKPFKDAKQYRNGEAKHYAAGDDVSHFNDERLKDLLKRGFVAEQ